MPGRPRTLTDAKQHEVCALIAAGCTLAAAARFVGCSPLTIQREARRNSAFQEGIRASRITAELEPVTNVRHAARQNWRAAAWLLERTQPQQYGKRAANSFGRDDIALLLTEVCDVLRQEIDEAERFTRIRRRVLALAEKPVASTTPFNRKLTKKKPVMICMADMPTEDSSTSTP